MTKENTHFSHIIKIDVLQHIVLGVVLQPGIPDLQNDIITAEEIEKTAHRYLAESRITGFRHQEALDAVIVESYIVRENTWFNDEQILKGSWIVAMKILDETVWKGVMDGIYNSFSIGGYAKTAEVENGINKT